MNDFIYLVAINTTTNKKLVLRRFKRLKGLQKPLLLVDKFKDILGQDWNVSVEMKGLSL